MSRDTSLTFRESVYSSSTNEAFIVLIDIQYDSTHIRLSSDNVDTVSNGNTFTAYPFEISLPSDPDESITRGSITIDNIDRSIVEAVRSATEAPDITIQIVLASDPDTIEAEFSGFKLSNVRYNALTVTADISIESFVHEPFPGDHFLPSTFPSLF